MPSGRGTVLHLAHVFPSFAVGGQQVRFVTLANALRDRYRHTVLAMDGNLTCRDLLDGAVDCHALPLNARKSSGLSIENLVRFRRHLARLRPDLLLTYNWGSTEWALVNRWRPVCPHLHFEDGFGAEESGERQLRRRVLFRRLALTGPTTRVVVPSTTLRRIALDVWRLDPERVLYIPNGIDCARFAQPPEASAAARIGRREDDLVIGTIGALRPEKNFGRLIRALAALPAKGRPPRLVVVGGGPERSALETLARDCGVADRVLFTGPIERPEGVLGLFDLFALSSDTEQMPYTILEAMAAGLPIVATDVGDVKAMVAAENRPFVVPKDDPARFVQALDRLLSAPGDRRRLGAANQQRARETFDQRAMIATYDGLFAAMTGAAGAAAAGTSPAV
jgi:glycosyltransferase involved in cell wall biosynthesis